MSDDYRVWSCPIKKLRKCNVSPRLIESQFTVSTRRSFTIKRTDSPIYHLCSKSNNFKFEPKRDKATILQHSVPKKKYTRQELKNKDYDKSIVNIQKIIDKNSKTIESRKVRSPLTKTSKCKLRKLDKCANQSIQTERQGVLSHFTSLVDDIGSAIVDNAAPWIPYVGATALAIALFGYFSRNVEKALCVYNSANELLSTFHFNDIPLIDEGHADEASTPQPQPTNNATVDPRTLRFHYNKLKWPLEPLEPLKKKSF